MFVLACCTNICKRISAAINRAMTTLPRSAKTLRDIPRRYSVKISARHGLINLELKTLKFLIFGAKGGLLKITPRHKSELVVTHTCTDSIFIDLVKYFPYLSCLWSRQQVETCPRRKWLYFPCIRAVNDTTVDVKTFSFLNRILTALIQISTFLCYIAG